MSLSIDDPPTTEAIPAQGDPAAVGEDPRRARKPLGQLALEAGLVSHEQLASAFSEIASTGKRLGEVLIGHGWIDERDLDRLLALQGPAPPPPVVDETEDPEPSAPEPSHAEDGAIARDIGDLLAEVEQRSAAVERRVAHEAEVEVRVAELQAQLEEGDRELAAARAEAERLAGLLEQRDRQDAAVRATLERVTRQLAACAVEPG